MGLVVGVDLTNMLIVSSCLDIEVSERLIFN